MTCLPRSVASSFARLRVRARFALRRQGRTEKRGMTFCDATRFRQLWSRGISILLFACMSLILMGAQQCDGHDATPAQQQGMAILEGAANGTLKSPLQFARPGHHFGLAPLLSGANGSQTGTASFGGNFTQISVPSTGSFLLARLNDCSLDLIAVTSSTDPGTVTKHYEQTLHQLASLKTTADVFPNGCAARNPGNSSSPGAWLGETSGNVLVFGTASLGGVFLFNSNNKLTETPVTSLAYASAVATADLNKDGISDLVVVNGNGASSAFVSVMLGNADGSFQSPVDYTTGGTYSTAAVIEDVNGDGKLDIVAVSADQQISVLLGNGDGTFQAAHSFAAPALPGYTSSASTPIVNLITADVNGDGKKDIICSNGLVLLGNGDGTFTAAATPAFPYMTASSNEGPNLASGDVNNDGKIDLVLNTGNLVSTWIGNGDGTFSQGNSYATINDTGFVTVTDLDGDGNADIYVGLANGGMFTGDDSNNTSAYALMGNGDGTFQGAPQLISGNYSGNNLADLNGDGVPDLVTLNQKTGALAAHLGDGRGAFAAGVNIAPPGSFGLNGYNFTMGSSAQASSFAVGDVNGDGKPDLVFVDNGLTAISSGGTTPITYPFPVYFVALGNGDGTFQTPVPYVFPQIAPAADFDITNTVSNLEITDVNQDGHADLISVYNEIAGGTGVNPYNQGIVVLTGNGDGTFKAPVLTSTYSSTTAPFTAIVPQIDNIGDLNGDGIPDLIVNSPGTTVVNFQLQTQLQTFLGNGDGTFKTPTTIAVGADAYDTVLDDLNKDGKLDLAVLAETSSSQAELVTLLGNGDGTFGTAAVSNLDGGDSIRNANLAAADFDGNGTVDLALLDPADFSGIFYGNGDGTFTSVNTGTYLVPKDLINLSGGAGAGTAVAVDLNKDGKPDILDGSVSLINIYGKTPTTTTTPTVTVTPSPSSITTTQSTTVTVAVSGGSGTATPTGSVTLSSGTYTSAATTLSSGSAAITVPAGSLATGTDTLTATYTPDSTSSSIYNGATGTGSVTVTAAAPGFALSNGGAISVEASATTGNTSTITVAPANGFTGTVNLSCAVTMTPTGATSPATCGVTSSVTISGTTTQNATLTVNTTSTTTAGAYAITVTGVAGAITQTTIVNVTVTAYVAPTFALTNSGNITVNPGATTANTSTITVTPSGGFTGAVALTCAIAPAAASDPATCALSPASVTITGATAGTSTLTLTTTAATTAALEHPRPDRARWYAAGGASLACILLFGLPARQRRWRTLLGMIVLFACLAVGIVSCGGGGGGGGGSNNGGGGGTSNPGTTAGTYTVTVTGTAGSTTETTAVTLTVN